ncbi:OLC1v1021841C1 [Oldenlandia corymbosa var. corymbosa]|uniref:OLC1v1021841C1 n=1 Tax=Oldenlandia corymbosa var. corymbosa TaxID=529605 RepID=A0AAV1BZ73_OLDCO|nr:OLC1v1021841C1 [Oldenlandia corymbosa var. corymbosa]
MESTAWNRLRNLFSKIPNPVKTTSAKPKPTIIGTPDKMNHKPAAGLAKPTQPEPISDAANPNKTSVDAIVKKFKASSDSRRFRKRDFYYEATVRRLASRGEFSAVDEILQHQKTYTDIADEGFAVRLICYYGKAKMFDEARKLFDELPSLNCERTVVSFNALLSACVNSRQYDKVFELFSKVPVELGIEPNVVSYNTVIKGFCAVGCSDEALSMLDEMEKNNVKPDAVTFNTLLNAFNQMENFSQAEKLWSLMEEKDVVANVGSYNARLRGLVARNQNAEAVELIDEMRAKGVALDVFSYNALLKGFVDDGNLEEAKRWYWNMIEHGLKPDKATFGMLVPFACDKDDFEFAFEMCKKAIKTNQKVYQSVVQMVIDGLVLRSKDDEAEILKKMASTFVFRKLN